MRKLWRAVLSPRILCREKRIWNRTSYDNRKGSRSQTDLVPILFIDGVYRAPPLVFLTQSTSSPSVWILHARVSSSLAFAYLWITISLAH